MTTIVSNDLRAHRVGDDVTSPELVLIDPDLGVLARARLPDLPAASPAPGRPQPLPRRRILRAGSPTALDGHLLELARRIRRRRHARLVAGCAAAAVLVLVLAAMRMVGDTSSPPSAAPETIAPPGPNAQPPTTPPTTPTTPRSAKPIARRFVWAPAPRASGYHIEFFRGSRRVFVRETTTAAVVVPARWTYAGDKRSLGPGTYTWYVWPIVDGRRAAAATVQASVSIPR